MTVPTFEMIQAAIRRKLWLARHYGRSNDRTVEASTRLDDLLEALAMAPDVGWQSVETAPIGQDVILYCPDGGCLSNPERIEFGNYNNGRGSYHSCATLWMPPPPFPARD